MKKSLLFGAAALMAFAANAQTMTGITKVWEHSMSAYTSSVARSIAALGDKAVIPNRSNGMVEVWDETGKIKQYDVNSYIIENIGADTDDNGWLNRLGHAISTDEAGNIIVNVHFASVNSSKVFVVIRPDGSMFHLNCEYPRDAVVPDGAGRMDYLGDKTAGDVTQNGFIIACPQNMNYAITYCIYNLDGDISQDTSYSHALKLGDEEYAEVWDAESSAIPLVSMDQDAEFAPEFIARRRGIFNFFKSNGSEALMPVTFEGGGNIDWSKSTTSNFTAWTVGDKSYVALTQPDNGVRTHSWEVFDLQTAQSLARWTMPESESAYYQVGFASSVNEDGTVNIFQFNPGIRLAKYIFDPSAGVEGAIADDVNAPVKYYNLQGVEIANPENGLFIKKQGAKATKVVL